MPRGLAPRMNGQTYSFGGAESYASKLALIPTQVQGGANAPSARGGVVYNRLTQPIFSGSVMVNVVPLLSPSEDAVTSPPIS